MSTSASRSSATRPDAISQASFAEDDFRPLRLQNGLYIQKHAPMLRVAIPYGLLSAQQLARAGAHRAPYDRGYGHFSTRQNIQFNWPALEDVPDILARTRRGADARDPDQRQLHPQHHHRSFRRHRSRRDRRSAGVVRADPPVVDLPSRIRLPAAQVQDRGQRQRRPIAPPSQVHDIGLHAVRGDRRARSASACSSAAGSGAPLSSAHVIREFLPWQHLLTYLDAILRVYNRHGRRDNKYKARIKILVKDLDADAFTRTGRGRVGPPEATARHTVPAPKSRASRRASRASTTRLLPADQRHASGASAGQRPALRAGRSATCIRIACPATRRSALSLKRTGTPPGDVDADQMDAIAALADRYSFGELRVTHEQNLVLADVAHDHLPELWPAAAPARAGHAQHRPAHATSSPARGATSARWPMRCRFRWPRRSSGASTISTTCTTSASSI